MTPAGKSYHHIGGAAAADMSADHSQQKKSVEIQEEELNEHAKSSKRHSLRGLKKKIIGLGRKGSVSKKTTELPD